MSDYFGALMRASGLAAAAAQRPHHAREALPPAPEDGAVETRTVVATGHSAPGAPAAPAAAGTPARTRSAAAAPPATAVQAQSSVQGVRAAAVAPPPPKTTPAHASVPPAAPSPPVVDGEHRGSLADGPRVRVLPDPNSPHSTTPETDPAAPAGVSAAPSRVGAALQWIAADPHSVNPGTSPERHTPHAGSTQPWPSGASSPADAPTASHSPHAVHARDDAAPLRSTAIEAWLREPAIPPHASRRLREHDDAPGALVEVSIGTIHVRVDAPAAQTRLAPAAPAAAPRAQNRPAPRDAVARRLLRRI